MLATLDIHEELVKESVRPGGVAGYQTALWSASCILGMCLYDTREANGVIAERVGSHGTVRLTVAKKIRPWCPDRLLALYGRGDDDDGQRDAARSSDSQETGVPTTSFCTECLGRAKPSLPLVEAKRRTHRLVPEPASSEGAEG